MRAAVGAAGCARRPRADRRRPGTPPSGSLEGVKPDGRRADDRRVMNVSLQEVVANVKTSRSTQLALVCVLAAVAVLAMVMAFRAPAGEEFVGTWSIPDLVNGGTTTAHIYRTADGFALQVADPHVMPVPYRFEHGELVPAPGYENCSTLSLVGKKLVVTPPAASATPRPAPKPAPTLSPSKRSVRRRPSARRRPSVRRRPSARRRRSARRRPSARRPSAYTAGLWRPARGGGIVGGCGVARGACRRRCAPNRRSGRGL